jgi:hypothetical protein
MDRMRHSAAHHARVEARIQGLQRLCEVGVEIEAAAVEKTVTDEHRIRGISEWTWIDRQKERERDDEYATARKREMRGQSIQGAELHRDPGHLGKV